MNKEQKIILIKAWLQMFGDRDNETFYIEVIVPAKPYMRIWNISIQYNYDWEEGYEITPYNWCRFRFDDDTNNKLGRNASISDRSEEELDEIIEALNKIKVCW